MYEKIFSQTFPGFLSIRDSEQKIIYLNENFKNWIKEYTDVDAIGKTNEEIARLVPENVADTFLQCHDASLVLQNNSSTNYCLKKIIEFKSKSGIPTESQYFDVLKYQVMISGVPHIFTIAYNITKIYIENLHNLFYALTDTLTGAYNRRYIDENLDKVCGHLAAIVDMDKFKMVNDLEGHLAGDSILKEFVPFITRSVPGITEVVRLGGDEFLIIFSDGFEEKELYHSLEAARNRFKKKYEKYPYLSFSFGIGTVGSSIDETIIRLDKNMYADKSRIDS